MILEVLGIVRVANLQFQLQEVILLIVGWVLDIMETIQDTAKVKFM